MEPTARRILIGGSKRSPTSSRQSITGCLNSGGWGQGTVRDRPRQVSAPISGVKTESSADLTERTGLEKAMDRAAAQAEEARRSFDQLRRAAEDFE